MLIVSFLDAIKPESEKIGDLERFYENQKFPLSFLNDKTPDIN